MQCALRLAAIAALALASQPAGRRFAHPGRGGGREPPHGRASGSFLLVPPGEPLQVGFINMSTLDWLVSGGTFLPPAP